MAKRKRSGRHAQPTSTATDGFEDRSASKLTFNSYEDLADSEDEFHLNRDKIALGQEGPEAKKRRKGLQRFNDVEELSDEEVLAYPESEDEGEDKELEEEESDEDNDADDRSVDASDNEGEDEDYEDEISAWGPSKADYYNADAIETEQDALDEEAEARRIQQKRLKNMRAEDFEFDGQQWMQSGQDDDGQRGVVKEDLPQLEISEDMSNEERLKLLKSRYPEFEPLSEELIELQPLYEEMSQALKSIGRNGQQMSSTDSILLVKHRALSSYLGALAMYFAILTSTFSDNSASAVPLPPYKLRDHEIMDSLVQCRNLWTKVSDLSEDNLADSSSIGSDESDGELIAVEEISQSLSEPVRKATVKKVKKDAATKASDERRAERSRRTEESLAALSSRLDKALQRKPQATEGPQLAKHDADSDLGDEDALAPHEAAEKAKRRKSLRFYTSQIAQKANKRANASRAAGGDDDLPYRERLRDRQERLMREAENRAKKKSRPNDPTRLDGESDEGETNRQREEKQNRQRTENVLDEEDQYEAAVMERAKAKKEDKRRRDEAYRQAREEGGKVVYQPTNEVGPDGRRQVSYAIEKNKGLMPKRKKEVKNPRVKKRKRFEDKSKKLRSMRPTYKGGEGRGGYAGELTGIKAGLVRSVKL